MAVGALAAWLSTNRVQRLTLGGGSYENIRLLEHGRIDMAEIQADAGSSDLIQGVMKMYGDAYHLVV